MKLPDRNSQTIQAPADGVDIFPRMYGSDLQRSTDRGVEAEAYLDVGLFHHDGTAKRASHLLFL